MIYMYLILGLIYLIGIFLCYVLSTVDMDSGEEVKVTFKDVIYVIFWPIILIVFVIWVSIDIYKENRKMRKKAKKEMYVQTK